MACTPIGFKSSACRLQGGIRAIYFGAYSDVAYNPVFDTATGEVTSIGVVELVKFENTQNVGTAVETITRDTIVSYAQVVTASGRGFTPEAIQSLDFLAKAEVFAIVHYNSGVSRLYGAKYFMLSSGGENTSGEGSGDSNTFAVELTGVEVNPAPLLKGSTNNDPFDGFTVKPNVDSAIITTEGPDSIEVEEGEDAVFTVVASGGVGTLNYQWFQNGGAVSGEITASFTITAATINDNNGDVVYCEVTDDIRTVSTGAAVLTVVPVP